MEMSISVEETGEVEMEVEQQQVNGRFENFGEYAAIAERIDQFILEGMGYSAYRMIDIKEGESYHRKENKGKNGFAKIGYHGEPFLLLRFGKKSVGDHIGIVKQIEIDRNLRSQKERGLGHIYDYPNEAFIYLKYVADKDNEQTWKFIQEKVIEAYNVYYKKK